MDDDGSETLLSELRPVPVRRPIDRIAAALAALALLGSLAATLWFFLGFVENDPEFRASSSAFLLALGLGAFAIIPSAVVLRLCLSAAASGFRPAQGWWTLVLIAPWTGLAALMLLRAPLPGWAPALALILSALLCLWAIIALILERRLSFSGPDDAKS